MKRTEMSVSLNVTIDNIDEFKDLVIQAKEQACQLQLTVNKLVDFKFSPVVSPNCLK